MEQYWIIFAIIASLCIGFYGFAQKMKAELPEQSETGFIVYSYVGMGLTGLIGMLISEKSIHILDSYSLLYAFLITVFYLIIIKTRLKSLKYLSSSTYFINYRIISSLWLIIIGTIFFGESISLKEGLGIAVGFVVFYLLLEKKKEKESISDVRKGFLYLFLGSLAVMGVQGFGKNFALGGNDIFTLMFFQGFFGIITAVISKGGEKIKNIFIIQDMKQGLFLGISAILFGAATMFNLFAFTGGDLAIVYKIISYSLFIPIILSIIIYKEQVTPRKLFAFVLTLISIFLFI